MTNADLSVLTSLDGISEALDAMAEIYADAFNGEAGVGAIAKIAGYYPKGKVVADASIVKGSVNISLRFEYDDKNPDTWELAQRYIFDGLFRLHVETFEERRQQGALIPPFEKPPIGFSAIPNL